MVYPIDHMVARCKDCIYISALTYVMSTQITFVIRSDRTKTSPVFFRMNEDRMIFCRSEI